MDKIKLMNDALENNDYQEMVSVLNELVINDFSISHVSSLSDLRRESLYKCLGKNSNMYVVTLMLILKSVGLRIKIYSDAKINIPKLKTLQRTSMNRKLNLKENL